MSVDEFDIWKYVCELREIVESKGSIPETLISILGMKKIVNLVTVLIKDSSSNYSSNDYLSMLTKIKSYESQYLEKESEIQLIKSSIN